MTSWADGLLNGGPMNGTLGYLSTWRNPADFANLPEWIRRQIVPVNQDEHGTTYGFNGLTDQNGNQVLQLNEGLLEGDTRHNGNIYDRSQVHYDPSLGLITNPQNLSNVQSASMRNGLLATQLLVASMAGAGAYMAAGGAGAGAAAGEGLVDTLGAGTAADGFAGANMGAWGASNGLVDTLGAGTAADGFAGTNMGAWGEGTSGLLGPGVERITVTAPSLADASPFAADALAPLAPFVPPALNAMNPAADPLGDPPPSDRPWYQGLLDNPLQTLGRGYSLYQLGRGLLNNDDDNPPPNNDNNPDNKGGNGQGLSPLQRDPWTPNPITAAQIQNFQYARPRGM